MSGRDAPPRKLSRTSPARLGGIFPGLAQRLHAGRRRSEEIINSIPVVVFELEQNAKGQLVLTWVSAWAETLLGYPLEEWRRNRRLWIETIEPSQQEQVESALRTLLDGSSSVNLELTWIRRSGRPVLISLHASPVVLDGAGPGLRCVASDETARRTAEREASEKEKQFRTLVEHTSDIITIIDTDGIARYQSPSIERVLGWLEKELIGTRVFQLIHPEDRERCERIFAELLGEAGSEERLEFRFRHREGSWRTLECLAVSIGTGSVVEGVVATSRDVTERRMLEAQLERASRVGSLGRLAATVAHEFNNLLMGIQPFAELLRRNPTPENVERATAHIFRAIDRGRGITGEILRFSRPAQMSTRAMDLRELVLEFGNELSGMLRADIHSQLELPQTPLWVECDREQITQALSNLCGNARDAMETGGILRISLRHCTPDDRFSFGHIAEPQRFAQLTVSDTGPGLSPEARKHLFEPLFTTKSNGTGLGLAVTHQVVRGHEGLIFAESRPGNGTRFHIFLPLRDARTEEQQAPAAIRGSRTVRRLVLVEDEEPVAAGISALLELEGIEVRVAPTAAEALPLIREFAPDLVILDLGLPDRDGLDLYVDIAEEWPTLPVIFSSGHGDAAHIGNMVPRRNVRFLQKPYQLESLMRAIEALWEHEVDQ